MAADVEIRDNGSETKVRSKKQVARVDLTAMVDLAFLLITFFMLTTSLAKPHAMDVAMPDDSSIEKLMLADERTMTVLLGSNNKVGYYMGLLNSPLDGPKVTDFRRGGIRPILLAQMKKVSMVTGDPKKGLIVVIRPSDKASYMNLVDILDEMKIIGVTQYMIGDIGEAEIELLKREGIYN